MRITGPSVVLALAAPLAACDHTPPEAPLARIDLTAAMGIAAPAPVGVTVDAAGTRYLFDQNAGLYRVGADRSVVRVLDLASLPTPDVPWQPPLTDLVALGPDQFALTAVGDGYVLDTAASTMTQHFCYVPSGPEEELIQRTDALAYDPVTDRIYAEPIARTLGGDVRWAMIAGYQRETGLDVEWHDLPSDVHAGGMIAAPGRGLVLGDGSRLLAYDLSATVSDVDDLDRFGVDQIEGLAVDPVARTLLVLDGAHRELVEIELARVGL